MTIKKIVYKSQAKEVNSMNIKKNLLLTVVIATALFLVLAGTAFAVTREVPGPYPTIQAAVNAASDGDTINVAAGTYDEQVVINKELTLQGAGSTTIVKPSSATKLTQVFDGLFWYGSPNTKNIAGIIVANVPDGSSVTLKNLKVDGSSVTTKPEGADLLAGIFYRETGGTVDTVSVVGGGAWSGADDRGYGAYLSAATNTVSVEVKGSSISNFDKNGIEAQGNKLTVNIHHNTITGRGPITDEVQNGVNVGRDATGTVDYNTISNLAYSPETYWSAAIMFYHYVSPTGVSATAQGNTITNSQIGIIVKNANGSAQGNAVSGGTVGLIGLYAEPNASGTWTASFVGNTVSGVRNSGTYENAAIGAGTYNAGASLTVIIEGNQLTSGSATADGIIIGGAAGSVVATIRNNTISNWQRGVWIESAVINAANVSVNFNNISGNQVYGAYNGGTGTLNAENNWWGNAGGPGVGGANPVGGLVDYTPWITNGTAATYNNSTGTTYNLPAGNGSVSIPAGNGALGNVTVFEAPVPSGSVLGVPPGTVFIQFDPSVADFGADKSKWPIITLKTTSPMATYVPYYNNGTAWVPYASSDYADLSNVEGKVTVEGGNIKFKVKHTTPIGGGGAPVITGANIYALLALALLAIGLGLGLLLVTRRVKATPFAA